MIKKYIKKNKGFVILFAVTLAALLLSIALGVANIALKEIKFGTNARDTNEAFFAADSGAECALLNDKTTSSAFPAGGGAGTVACASSTPTFAGGVYSFVVTGLGSSGQGCAKVTVDKSVSLNTKVVSRGYNTGSPGCNSTSASLVERQLELNY